MIRLLGDLALVVLFGFGPPQAPLSKKDAYLAAKTAADAARAAPSRAQRPVWAHALRTHEIAVLEGPGALVGQPARESFFRCWFTLAPAAGLDPDLVQVLVASAHTFGVNEVRIISGFRHPKYNLLLRKKGREVASRSQHTRANAIDFFLPGVDTKTLYQHLLRSHRGGVGYYPVSSFVHVDFGKKRTWRGT